MTRSEKRSATKGLSGGSLALILVGIALATIGNQLDGFVGGMGQGAGVALIICGAYLVGVLWRQPKGPGETWLPSRDGDN
ncbi:hypothetical protein [Nocardioides houyundeii]|uniref:hypothetical protein n=1 Tax=Nocardioides houyundeii TaxID=2045452 RepID=UPI000DF33CD6|nr:hypothetical protein [Nocardioides houyundeii]